MSAGEETIIFTVEEVTNLKSYVSMAQALPTENDIIEDRYNTKKLNENGLSASDIGELFSIVRNNAGGWPSIQIDLIVLMDKLLKFAEVFKSSGLATIKILESIPGYKEFNAQVSGLTQEQINSLPLNSMREGYDPDLNKVEDIYNDLAADVKKHRDEIVGIEERVSRYKRELSDEVLVAVTAKLNLVGSDLLDREIAELNKEIEKENLEVAKNQKILKEMQSMSVWPEFTEIYIVRPLASSSIKKRDELLVEVGRRNEIRTILERIKVLLKGMEKIIAAALDAVRKIESIWILTLDFAKSSVLKITNATKMTKINSLVGMQKGALNDWQVVQDYMQSLKSAFES
ncbi:hypothetical protein [Pseudomonas salmasensis]|uniref:hypothetical protein n=1 Tax=Pseudomonas salmasensis TaxID=2745514 RepID=UPI0016473D41|nr:hypothetical protein [Pseudomonas salmasensis]QXH76734.1 hypothetical protein HU731_020170 [Pseudomonas salmasensis]